LWQYPISAYDGAALAADSYSYGNFRLNYTEFSLSANIILIEQEKPAENA
jgi:hypothetical protein